MAWGLCGGDNLIGPVCREIALSSTENAPRNLAAAHRCSNMTSSGHVINNGPFEMLSSLRYDVWQGGGAKFRGFRSIYDAFGMAWMLWGGWCRNFCTSRQAAIVEDEEQTWPIARVSHYHRSSMI